SRGGGAGGARPARGAACRRSARSDSPAVDETPSSRSRPASESSPTRTRPRAARPSYGLPVFPTVERSSVFPAVLVRVHAFASFENHQIIVRIERVVALETITHLEILRRPRRPVDEVMAVFLAARIARAHAGGECLFAFVGGEHHFAFE